MTWMKRPGIVLVVLLAIAGVRACLYAFILIPPWQAPDEPGHYAYARELAEFGLRAPTPAQRLAGNWDGRDLSSCALKTTSKEVSTPSTAAAKREKRAGNDGPAR